MELQLTDEQQQALARNHRIVQGTSYVLRTMDINRQMMGIGTDDEQAESLQVINRGLADVEAGRTRPFRDVLNELGSTDVIHR